MKASSKTTLPSMTLYRISKELLMSTFRPNYIRSSMQCRDKGTEVRELQTAAGVTGMRSTHSITMRQYAQHSPQKIKAIDPHPSLGDLKHLATCAASCSHPPEMTGAVPRTCWPSRHPRTRNWPPLLSISLALLRV